MTRKDYRLIASAIDEARDTILRVEPRPFELLDGVVYVLNYLETYLEHDNPRFDRNRFREACGF